MSTDIALPSDRRVSSNITSQATAIEQARAIAEVQASVVVAQQCPRDIARAEGETRDVCGRMSLANRAFYRVPKRGSGPSVHLARELARIWGNVQYGVWETRRDDEAGESEIQAWAWDVQTNTRSSRSFVVPHQRMVQGERKRLVDLGDVYLNNQSVGARAVRECIYTVLPTWLVELAEETCRTTLRDGDGKPLSVRIDEMAQAFAGLGVKVAQIETKLGRKRGQWDAGDVASMAVLYSSIQRGEVTVAEEFGDVARVTAADVLGDGAAPSQPVKVEAEVVIETGEQITGEQRRAMFAAFSAAGFTTDARAAEGRAQRLDYIGQIIDRTVLTTNDLTAAEASTVIDALNADAQQQETEQ